MNVFNLSDILYKLNTLKASLVIFLKNQAELNVDKGILALTILSHKF